MIEYKQNIPDLEVGETYRLSYLVKVAGGHWLRVSKLIKPEDKEITIRPEENIRFSQQSKTYDITNIQVEGGLVGDRAHSIFIDDITIKPLDNLPNELFRL